MRERFAGHEVDQLWSPWLLHAGLAPDQATGGLMLPVMAFTMHAVGLPVVEGGAGRFTEAFGRLLAERGVEVLLGRSAERIEVRDGRAVAVHVGGRRLAADKAVLASTATGRLYGDAAGARATWTTPGGRPWPGTAPGGRPRSCTSPWTAR